LLLALLLVLISLPIWLTYGVARQERCNIALLAAIKRGDTNAVRSLLNAGADPDATNNSGRHVSVWQHFTLLFRRMFGQSSKPPAKGDTALLLATNAYEVRPAIVLALLARGADVRAKDHIGDTALLALGELRLLRGSRSLFCSPAESPPVVKTLLDKGVDINARNVNGETALMIAVQNGWTKTVGLLLDKRADVNVVAPGCVPGTALTLAIQNGYTDIAKQLIASKADVNLPDSSGSSPLTYAKGCRPIVRLLKQAGAKEYPMRKEGNHIVTPFDCSP
jgi:ankyrin repeat protein